ncbi:protein O-linked-mannose beta-1,2-N-acetylglucosaminyltransferase 1-like [Babylonia areolata]|uniref:protein O-linked-mannose beta-1,2-N-acetylglucosaminyltransferase 1-like n=1 Tax=Babylonia areolata TaxID=304850 RepID=UPI003FD5025D
MISSAQHLFLPHNCRSAGEGKMFRALRRLLVKRFGGVKHFLVLVTCVGVILYCLHSLFSDGTRQVWDVRGSTINISSDNGCGIECRPDQLSFYIRTGEKTTVGPTVCFEGNIIISNDLKNFGRGLNFVVLQSNTLEVKEVRAFDTYVQDAELIRFLKKGIPDDSIVIVVSFDEASSGLHEDSRKWMKLYGSGVIDNLAFRDSLIMIGQKGLKEGHAIEYISKKDKSEDFSAVLEKAGCFSLPLGPQDSLQVALPDMLQGRSITLGDSLPLCGLPSPCPADSVSVGVYSGNKDKKPPFICVGGRIVMTDNVNKGGRGFNTVALNSASLQPVSVMHADTYATDSTDLELYLESLSEGDIVISVVADDGAKKLSYSARDQMNTLGSGYIQNLRFRDVWFFIGQRGMDGFTTMEQISYAGYDGDWPKPINKSYCVPRKLVGRKIIPDPEFYRFDERRDFCKKYDGYPEFCDPSRVDDKLKTVGTADKSLQGHAIFDTPLIIVPGLNHNALVRTLETTLMQPGIKQKNVVVMWDKKFPEHGELATLFGFTNISLPSSTKYTDLMGHALKHSVNMFPQAEHFIVLEEELLLAPDFLSFLAQCFSTLNTDPTLLAVSAWNFNGFEKTSGNREIVYRVEEFPGLGFLAKKQAVNALISSMPQKRAWHGWKFEGEGHFEILMPDVSRVFRQPFKVGGQEAELVSELFLHPRTTSLEQAATLQNLGELMERQYEDYLNGLIASSLPLTMDNLKQCVHSLEPPPDFADQDKRSVAVYFDQESSLDFRLFSEICRCFGLVSPRNWRPKNLHNGMLRFWYQDRNVFLVGSSTPYYKNKPAQDKVPH